MITRIFAFQQTGILTALLACLSMAFQCETTVGDGQDAKSFSAAPTLAHESHFWRVGLASSLTVCRRQAGSLSYLFLDRS